MKRSSQDPVSGDRPLDGLAIWGILASFGILIGVLALARNLERDGAGRRWRRAHATGAEVDALLAADELEEAG